MKQLFEAAPSPAAGLLQLARLKSGISQAEQARRAGVSTAMISAYERGRRQPTLPTLMRLLRAAGFDLRLHLELHDSHDDSLSSLERRRSRAERARRDQHVQAWRDATPSFSSSS